MVADELRCAHCGHGPAPGEVGAFTVAGWWCPTCLALVEEAERRAAPVPVTPGAAIAAPRPRRRPARRSAAKQPWWSEF